MADINNWAMNHLKELLRDLNDPFMIEEMSRYVLNIDNEETLRTELTSMLNVDSIEQSAVVRARKLDFIDELCEKKFKIIPKKRKKKGVKIEMSKKNI